jgi:hypothetical protein
MPHDKLKRQITAEAARLVSRGQETNLARARLTAARNLAGGWVHPANLPTDLDIRAELQLQTRLMSAARPEADSREEARFAHYRSLLEPLAHVMQPRDRHPEGDALYHSLQVFVLVQQESPWDEELLLAALLHDVGKGIDPLDHVAAGLEALEGWISERTAWLIANHLDAQRLHEGELGRRAMRRLRGHEDFDALLLLARSDRAGRLPGAAVPDLEEALDTIREIARLCGEEEG